MFQGSIPVKGRVRVGVKARAQFGVYLPDQDQPRSKAVRVRVRDIARVANGRPHIPE